MKKLIGFLVVLVILGAIAFGCYKFFFDCNEVYGTLDKYFTLEKLDYAHVDKFTVKLLDIEDNRCLEENCEREGQIRVKVLVKDDRHITIVELGTLSETVLDLKDKKLDCAIELIETDGNKATFNVTYIK